MKKSYLIIILLCFVFTTKGFAQFGGGSGVKDDPYQISTITHLKALSSIVANDESDTYCEASKNKYWKLMNDIDMSGVDDFIPIGGWKNGENYYRRTFAGYFDGNSCKIKNLSINMPEYSYIALFGACHDSAVVQNLGVVNGNFTGKNYVGGLVGYNRGIVINCYATGMVNGSNYAKDYPGEIGGLIAYNEGAVKNCYTDIVVKTINKKHNCGGLIGWCHNNYKPIALEVSNCYAMGDVKGSGGSIGGLVGRASGTHIYNCSASGKIEGSGSVGGLVGSGEADCQVINCHTTAESIKGSGDNIGGLVGRASKTHIYNCSASGKIEGSTNVGGLVGNVSGGQVINCHTTTETVKGSSDYTGGLIGGAGDASIYNCSASGKIEGNKYVGGLVGTVSGGSDIINSYTTGIVTGVDYIGGLIGYNAATVRNCYAAIVVNGQTGRKNIGGLIGQNTEGRSLGNLYFDTIINIDLKGIGNFPNDPSVTEKTTEELKSKDFIEKLNTWVKNNTFSSKQFRNWEIRIDKNQGYPIFESRFVAIFKDYDQTIIKEDSLEAGAVIIKPSPDPTRQSTGTHQFTFKKWQGFTDGMAIFQNQEFLAEYTASPIRYAAIFRNYDQSIFKIDSLVKGSIILKPINNPKRASTSIHNFFFKEWLGFTEGMDISSHIEFLAAYDSAGLSIEKSYITAVKLYPNPTRGEITIEANEATKYTIYNTLGIVQQTGILRTITNIQVSDLPTGVYFISFNDNKRGMRKFIKQ